MAENTLYYGDNLDVLRQHIKDESVNLIYLHPAFNSNQAHNVLFSDKSGTQSPPNFRFRGKHLGLQILTVTKLLAGKKIDYPTAQGVNVTFEKAPKAKTSTRKQQKLGFGD
ncbi:MAG: hypothetical protein ACYCZF_04755 [Anaerolineae bacterium]